MRLGVFADLIYRRDGDGLSTDVPFIAFLLGLSRRVDEVVLFGRLDPAPGRAPYPVSGDNVRFVPLPHYPSVRHLGALARARSGAVAAFSAELGNLDVAWLFGPHPISLAMSRAAGRAGVPIVLGVRQDLPLYIRGRLPSRGWRVVMPAVHGLELAYRRLARRAPAIVVGEDVGARYRAGDAPVLVIVVSLITAADVVGVDDALARSWDGSRTVLSVTRLDPEKNPLLLGVVLTDLRVRDPQWRMIVAGTGPLAEEMARRHPDVTLAGHVAQGAALIDLYRSSHAFLHVSLTEGVPQVLYEAMAAGLPIVATDVGGVRAALHDGELGLLVPPQRAAAAAAALERLAADAALRARLVRAGIAHAAEHTIDVELDRVAAFLRDAANVR